MGLHSVSKLGHDDLINSCQWRPIIGHIDLISSLLKIPTYLLHLDPNSTPIHGNCIPSPPTFAVRVDGNFHAFPWFGGYLWSWRIYVQDIYVHIWTTQGQGWKLTQMEGQGWSMDLVWRSRPYPYMDENGHLKVKVGHLTILAWLPLTLSLVW